MEAAFSFQMVKQGINDEIKTLKAKVSDATSSKASTKPSAGDDDEEDKDQETRDRLADYLKGLSKKFGSFALTQMVSSARADPFAKIKGLIEDMVEKLVTEANEEANQKAFCDEEQSKARAQQQEKSMQFDKFTSRIDETSAKKEVLGQAIHELQAELAEIDRSQGEANKMRAE